MRILFAEDDRDLSNAIKRVLEINKYEVHQVYDGQEALDYVEVCKYDVIILDVMMPKKNGIEVVKALRQMDNHTPVLLLTALSEIDDKVNGLDSGADDYLTKPFQVKELIARIRALSRRSELVYDSYSIGNLTLNPSLFLLSTDEKSVRLTNKEYKLMELFIRNRNALLSTEKIMESVWEFDTEAEINVVWVYISILRKKLEEIKANCRIKAVRGVGYKLEEGL